MKVRVAGKVAGPVAAVTLLIASALVGVAGAGPTQAAAATCSVRFPVNTWTVDANDQSNYTLDDTGVAVWTGQPTAGVAFLGTLQVTNAGDALDPWKVAWTTPPNTRLLGAGIFNAGLVRRSAYPKDTLWVASPLMNWPTSLPAGGRLTFGFEGVVPDPTITRSQLLTTFALPGRTCTIVS